MNLLDILLLCSFGLVCLLLGVFGLSIWWDDRKDAGAMLVGVAGALQLAGAVLLLIEAWRMM